MDEKNPLPGRITHRLNLDSEEQQQRQQQERRERQQYQRQKQQKRKRKQEKRRAKEQEQRAAKQQAQRKAEQRKKQLQKYNDPAKLFTPDSDSGVSFSRIKRKIDQIYPKFSKKKQRKQSSSSEESQGDDSQDVSQGDSQSQSQSGSSQSQSSSHKKKQKKVKKNQKPQKRRRNNSDSSQVQNKKKIKTSTVKLEPQMSGKDRLVQDVAVRWNYALPEWPPVDYNYEAELKKRGYRSVEFSKFKFVDEVVDGLVKVYELDGYRGVYRGKLGLIDVRPKDNSPSLNYFYSKSDQELYEILKKALARQIQLLQQVQFKQSGQEKLLEDLKRKLRQLSR